MSRRYRPLLVVAGLLVWPASGIAAGPLSLVDAVKTGSVEAVRALLLQQRVEVNAGEPDGATALHWAAHRGQPEIVELLLRAGARVSVANRYGVRPLSLAAANGGARAVKLLLKAGADPNTAMTGGESALMTAARAGSLEVVRVLVDYGANVDAREETRGQTALMWAAAEGHADVIRVLVQGGADLRAVSHGPSSDPHITDGEWSPNASGGKRVAPRVDAFTPLQFAVQAGQLDAVRALIASGANVADETPQGMNTLLLAIANCHFELAAFLLENGADLNAVKTGFTALHQLVRVRTLNIGLFPHPIPTGRLSSLDLAKALLAHGATVDARTAKRFTDGYRYAFGLNATPFLLATKGGDLDMMRLLVANGADPYAKNANGTTAVLAAAGVRWGTLTRIAARTPRD